MALFGLVLLVVFGLAAFVALITGSFALAALFIVMAAVGLVILTVGGLDVMNQTRTARPQEPGASPTPRDLPGNVPLGPLKLVEAEPYEKEDDRDEVLHGTGYHIRTVDVDFAVTHRDLTLEDAGAEVVNVAEAAYHPEVLASDGAAAGSRLHLRAAPDNEHDPNAVEVHVEGEQDTHLGFVPATEAPRFQPLLLRGEKLEALVLWEWSGEDGERRHLNALVYRAGVVDTEPVTS